MKKIYSQSPVSMALEDLNRVHFYFRDKHLDRDPACRKWLRECERIIKREVAKTKIIRVL